MEQDGARLMKATGDISRYDGIINFFKPAGITSARALYRVRKITGVRKSGHAGTLDPLADGVLIICQQRATKLVERFMDLPKVYRATARLDVTSESFDSDRPLEPVHVASKPARTDVREALRTFEGRTQQVPPRISAVKVGGVPAYKTAGRSDAPALRARRVEIYWIQLRRFDWPRVEFDMACGRGTYVRALVRDLAARLGTGGCLTALTRLAVGPFRSDQAWTLDRLEHAGRPESYLVPLAEAARMVSQRPVAIPERPQERC